MPSILFINRVYPPECGATGRVLEYAARGFAKSGWDVSVVTTAGASTMPGKSIQDDVKVIRVASSFSKDNLLLRALGYGLMIPLLVYESLKLSRPEVVVTMTDPPMLALAGPILKLLKKSRLIHWAQDLYPEVAEEGGVFMKGGPVARFLRLLSSWSLGSHDAIIAIGRCMADRLVRRGVPNSRIRVIPNCGVERQITPVPLGHTSYRKRHGLGEEFVIMYSGNMGRAHDFHTVIEAARLLTIENEPAGVLFLFVGEGPQEAAVRETVRTLKLENIRFLPFQPGADLSQSLGMGDLHLVTMMRGVSGLVVPSKFYGVMAAARPTLFIGESDSEVARVITEKRIGKVIMPGDSSGLVSAIRSYRNDTGRIEEEGNRARESILQDDLMPCLIQEACRILFSRRDL